MSTPPDTGVRTPPGTGVLAPCNGAFAALGIGVLTAPCTGILVPACGAIFVPPGTGVRTPPVLGTGRPNSTASGDRARPAGLGQAMKTLPSPFVGFRPVSPGGAPGRSASQVACGASNLSRIAAASAPVFSLTSVGGAERELEALPGIGRRSGQNKMGVELASSGEEGAAVVVELMSPRFSSPTGLPQTGCAT